MQNRSLLIDRKPEVSPYVDLERIRARIQAEWDRQWKYATDQSQGQFFGTIGFTITFANGRPMHFKPTFLPTVDLNAQAKAV